jgi:hypothetical protein
VSDGQRLRRQDVVDLLAAHGGAPPVAGDERIDSLQLAWLLHQVEQRYGVELDPGDDELQRMTTVTGATEVLTELMEAQRG